jgi:hypothetical protein
MALTTTAFEQIIRGLDKNPAVIGNRLRRAAHPDPGRPRRGVGGD